MDIKRINGMQMLDQAMPMRYPLFEEYIAGIEKMVHDLRIMHRDFISATAYDTLMGIELSLQAIIEEAING